MGAIIIGCPDTFGRIVYAVCHVSFDLILYFEFYWHDSAGPVILNELMN